MMNSWCIASPVGCVPAWEPLSLRIAVLAFCVCTAACGTDSNRGLPDPPERSGGVGELRISAEWGPDGARRPEVVKGLCVVYHGEKCPPKKWADAEGALTCCKDVPGPLVIPQLPEGGKACIQLRAYTESTDPMKAGATLLTADGIVSDRSSVREAFEEQCGEKDQRLFEGAVPMPFESPLEDVEVNEKENRPLEVKALGCLPRGDDAPNYHCKSCKHCAGPGFTCALEENGADCGDGNICNGEEVCRGGMCQAGTPLCPDDGLYCNGVESCDPERGCVRMPRPCECEACDEETRECGFGIEACDDGNPCTVGTCAPGGVCSYEEVADGSDCSDGNICNGDEVCQGGMCQGGTPLCPDDGLYCNGVESCDPERGCVRMPRPCECEACNEETRECGFGVEACDDGNPCTVGICAPGGLCSYEEVADGSGCGDGNMCNGEEVCRGGMCQAGTPLCPDDGLYCNGVEICDPEVGCVRMPRPCECEACDEETRECGFGVEACDDGNPCTVGTCAPGGVCSYEEVADGSDCSDGNICNGEEVCQGGMCQAGAPLCPDDGLYCNGVESCDPERGCVRMPRPCECEACDEETRECGFGVEACDDGNPCTVGICAPGGLCSYEAVADGADCSDGDSCNGEEVCLGGMCQAGTPLCPDDGLYCNGIESCDPERGCVRMPRPCECEACDEETRECGFGIEACDDGNPCTVGTCAPGGVCSYEGVADGSDCSDGNMCNGEEVCQGGMCQGGTPLCPDDGLYCNGVESCDPERGCVRMPRPCECEACNEETRECGFGVEVCDDGNPCTVGICAPGGLCSYEEVADGSGCGDGNMCNGEEVCRGGMCQAGTPLCPDDGLYCNGVEICDPEVGCVRMPRPCECEACDEETRECGFGVEACDDGNPCTVGICAPGGLCSYEAVADGSDCDDGNPCTIGTCASGGLCSYEAVADGADCGDGDNCNGEEVCRGGMCQAGTPLCPDDGLYCNGFESCRDGECHVEPTCGDECGICVEGEGRCDLIPERCAPGTCCEAGVCEPMIEIGLSVTPLRTQAGKPGVFSVSFDEFRVACGSIEDVTEIGVRLSADDLTVTGCRADQGRPHPDAVGGRVEATIRSDAGFDVMRSLFTCDFLVDDRAQVGPSFVDCVEATANGSSDGVECSGDGFIVASECGAAVEVISLGRDGTPGGSHSRGPSISDDHAVVSFYSDAADLVRGDDNERRDVFVRNRSADQTAVAASGPEASQVFGRPTSVSGDGSRVAFYSRDGLHPIDRNGQNDVFVADLGTGEMILVSVGLNGVTSDGASLFPDMSSDGRRIVFQSSAKNLSAHYAGGTANVFVGAIPNPPPAALSAEDVMPVCPTLGAGEFCINPAISRDGSTVAFVSNAPIVPVASNGRLQVFVFRSGEFQIASVSSSGQVGNSDSLFPSLSEDGRFVAFKSLASNLVDRDTNQVEDIYVHDLMLGTTERISIGLRGDESDDASFPPAISGDGRFVAFGSSASNLAAADSNDHSNVFVRDRRRRVTAMVDVVDGADGPISSNGPVPDERVSITRDGGCIGFSSLGSNLSDRDRNSAFDVFVTRNPLAEGE